MSCGTLRNDPQRPTSDAISPFSSRFSPSLSSAIVASFGFLFCSVVRACVCVCVEHMSIVHRSHAQPWWEKRKEQIERTQKAKNKESTTVYHQCSHNNNNNNNGKKKRTETRTRLCVKGVK